MADFFKGLAGGFGTGLQFGQAMQQRDERERLREAMGLTPQEIQQRQATPEELGRAQAETQRLAAQDAAMFGLTPQEQVSYAPQMPAQGQRVGAPQYGLGTQTFNRMPTQQEIESARYGAAANVIAERDPMAAMRMRQEQVRMQREAELAPLQKQQLEGSIESQAQQRELTGIQIGGAKRTAAEAQQMDAFNAWRSQNPQADFGAMTAKAQELGMGTEAQYKIASNLTGIGEQEFKASQQRIDQIIRKNPSFDGLLKAHKESNDLDPGSHFEATRGKNGVVSLNRVDTATGRVIQPNVFSGNEAEATKYLTTTATNPATVIDYTMNLEKSKAAIKQLEASAAKDYAMGGYYAAGGRAMGGAGKGGLKQKVADFKEVYGRDPTESEKGILAGLVNKESNKPEFTPKEYAATIKSLTDAGFSQTDALIRADQLYGRGPADASVDVGLQKMNKTKATGTAAAPIEVQPGESRMTAPGTSVRGPLNQFLRESRRGILGGVEYFYTDPVTGRRYTTEQYNQLQTK